jgi:hypothetical protein
LSADAKPIPPRFYYLKRLTIAGLVLVAMLLGLRWWWGWVMNRRLAAAVQAMVAKGQPVYVSDFDIPDVPDRANAAVYYRRALAAWPKLNGAPAIPPRWRPPNRQPVSSPADRNYLDHCRPAIALLDEAEEAPSCAVWLKGVSDVRPTLEAMDDLGALIDDAAERAHAAGDDRLALNVVGHLWTLGNALDTSSPPAFAHEAALSVADRVPHILEAILPTLDLDRGDAHAANSAQLRGLIEHLSVEQPRHEGLIHSTMQQGLWNCDDDMLALSDEWLENLYNQIGIRDQRLHSVVLSPTTSHYLLFPLGHPLIIRDRLWLRDVWSRYVAAARLAHSYPDLLTRAGLAANKRKIADHPLLHPLDVDAALAPSYAGQPALIYLDAVETTATGLSYVGQPVYSNLAAARMAAAALAIKLYQRDHGRRPPHLDDLVPNYLPAIPLDPFDPDDHEIRYKPEGIRSSPAPYDMFGTALIPARAFALLYCVGPDGKDNGGQCFFAHDGSIDHRWEQDPDYSVGTFFLLDPPPFAPTQGQAPPPTPTPTTRP